MAEKTWTMLWVNDEEEIEALINYLDEFGTYEWRRSKLLSGIEITQISRSGLSGHQLIVRANAFLAGFVAGRKKRG